MRRLRNAGQDCLRSMARHAAGFRLADEIAQLLEGVPMPSNRRLT